MSGTLYVVPNLLGLVPPATVLPEHTLEVARNLTRWVVETPKAARAYLKSIGIARPIADLEISTLESKDAVAPAIAALHGGLDVGILSDAGCPGVADPGALLVAAAHERAIRVVPLVGPSAILLALMASGMNGQHFCFHGYLPVKPEPRASVLRTLEQQSRALGRTEIFIETPYRNAAMLGALAVTLNAATRICVAADLTLGSQTVECHAATQWRRLDHARFERRPAIFLLQA